ncbi:MAG: FkbM family methyltransferase [Actinomycetota bacterium]|nr:FkbM family methyltransferase [Actinomycetota bacterium]
MLAVVKEGGIPRAVTSFSLADNPDLSFVAAESLVLSQLYWYGEQGWEPDLVRWWRYFCRRSASVLELGANVGYFTVQGARSAPGSRYVAVEPHPVSLRICRANLERNGISTVELIGAAAVADPRVSTVRLLVPSDQLATPTVAFMSADTELPSDMAGDAATALEVPAVDIRSLLEGVDLLKLDVEGQEHALLSAAREYLSERRPVIFVEVLTGTTKLRALLADLCTRDGYRCYVPARGRLVELEAPKLGSVDLKEEYGIQDVILAAAGLPSVPPREESAEAEL